MANVKADPYLIVQLGNSIVKKTKTQLNNEIIELEYVKTPEGICHPNGELIKDDNLIIRLFDENIGIAGQLDKNNKVVLNINNKLLFNIEHEFLLKSKSNKVAGSLIVSISSQMPKEAYLKQYYFLVKHIFKHINETVNKNWLLECIPVDYKNDEYCFASEKYNMLVKKFSNKYEISNIVRKTCHFNELCTNFIDQFFLNRHDDLNGRLAQYLNQLVCYIDVNYQNILLYSDEIFFKDFLDNIFQLPKKLLCFLTNYRILYPFDVNSIVCEKDRLSLQMIELYELVQLILRSCALCYNKIKFKNEGICKEFENWCLKLNILQEFKNLVSNFNYSQLAQVFELCISEAVKKFVRIELLDFNNFIDSYDLQKNNNNDNVSVALAKLEHLRVLAVEILPLEIQIENTFFSECFTPIIDSQKFSEICNKVLLTEFLSDLEVVLAQNVDIMAELRMDDVKTHLYFFILVKQQYFDKYPLSFQFDNLIMEPFLIEFINRQKDEVVTYLSRINDVELDENDLMDGIEKHYSTSLTDLFSIFDEALDIVLYFETNDPTKNDPYQLAFAKLVKSKVLHYIVYLKNKFFFNSERKNVEIPSCVLINNLFKVSQLVGEIKFKLSNRTDLSAEVKDMFISLMFILNEDVTDIMKILSNSFCIFISNSFSGFSFRLYATPVEKLEVELPNLINDNFLVLLGKKMFICRNILFDVLFKELVDIVFKITIKCFQGFILYDHTEKLVQKFVDEKTRRSSILVRFLHVISNDSGKLGKETLQSSLKNVLEIILNFFCSHGGLNKAELLKSKEYVSLLKTLDLFTKQK
jgi:hypothetical protein